MNNKDYSTLSEITVKTQDELNMIPLDFEGGIYIEFGTRWNKAIVRNKYIQSVVACENSSVEARGNSSVVACENSSVEAWENSSVEAWENSSVVAKENSSVEAWENSSVVAWENSSVVACGNSSVVARGNSSVVACENSSVVAYENSSVEACENSSVVACENSSVEAWENSSVVACGNSSVVARGNSSVVARGNSSVNGSGNAQIVDRLIKGRIEITGNARIVYMPKTIEEYCDFYDIKHDKKKGKFFKCVHKSNGIYYSDNDTDFEYEIGRKIEPDWFDNNPEKDCGHGIHVAYLAWVLDYGRNWRDLAILEVEADLKDIVLPNGCPGKVRCKEVTVLREVPLEECGVYGKILAQRRTEDE